MHARRTRTFRPTLEALEDRLVPAPVVPAFSSLPGADHTIFLDFDGHVTTGKQWNSYFHNPTINSPAFNFEGTPDTFTADECTRIQNIWKRVAEDFIPFNVNVTTVGPGVEALRKADANDTKWGIRVVMTSDTENSGAGGIAFLGSFNWNSDTPVFVYNNGEKSAAEAASHEVGHSLYLEHDGTNNAEYYLGHGSGDTSWAPIMGAGYNSIVTQWDRGEYFRANNNGNGANSNKGRDDLFVITNYNGFGYRADDHGNAPATATTFTINGNALSGNGIIERTTDVDVFAFTTTGGDVTLNINPFRPGPNLDVKAELYNGLGNRVALSNPPSLLEATISADLPAGTYYLYVDGTGTGNPGANPPSGYTEYASLGRYTITGTSAGTVSDPNSGPGYVNVAAALADQGEGNTGKKAFTFTVTRTGNLSGATTVAYAVAGSGTNPADAADFYGAVLSSGTVALGDGEISKTLTLYVRGDKLQEPDEGFTVTLSNPSGNTELVLTTADGMIREDDTRATLQIVAGDVALPQGAASQASVVEGSDVVPTAFTFTVTRSGSVAGTATVKFQVVGVRPNSTGKSDFHEGRYPTGTIVFENGEASKEITILIAADSVIEGNEDFAIVLKKPSKNASIVGGTLQVTIENDDVVDDPDQDQHHDASIPDIFPPDPNELPVLVDEIEHIAKRHRLLRRDWLAQAHKIFADLHSWLN